MRRRYSREQWLGWIAEQASSGLTIARFCESIGVPENSFYRWRAKLAGEPTGRPGAAATSTDHHGDFVPLSIIGSTSVEIDLPCGAVVRVPTDDAMIRQVLTVLMESDRGDQRPGDSVC